MITYRLSSKKLRHKDLFTKTNSQYRKVLSGLIIHDEIIVNITSLCERGEKALLTHISTNNWYTKQLSSTPLSKQCICSVSYLDGSQMKRDIYNALFSRS